MTVTIKGSAETELVVKKSRFLGLACRADSEAEAQRILEQRRKQHYDARHHCFAYILSSGTMRCSDDGEPQGTAGVPMLEVVKKSGLTDVIVISTRYFGGTLLGAGGLMRAYTQSAADTLAAVKRVQRIECGVYQCRFDFSMWARSEKSLRAGGFEPTNIQFTDQVCADFCVNSEEESQFKQLIANLSLGKTEPISLGKQYVEIEI